MDSASLRRTGVALEVGIGSRDGPDVLGSVELLSGVLVVAVQPDHELLAAMGIRQPVLATSRTAPRQLAFGGCEPWQVDEVQLSLVGQLSHPDGAAAGIEMDQRIRVLLRRVHLGRGSPGREDKGDLVTQAVELSCETITVTLGLRLHGQSTPGSKEWSSRANRFRR